MGVQVSKEEQVWAKFTIAKLRRAYKRYLRAIQYLLGSKGIVELRQEPITESRTDEALAIKVAWEDFVKSLTVEERDFLEEIIEYGLWSVTKKELKRLKEVFEKAKERGVV